MTRLPMVIAAVFSWALAVAAGFALLTRYESTPGAVGKIPADWPVESGLTWDHSRPNLLMFAHPRCPCTLAGLAELARVAERCGGAASIRVLFVRPEGTDEGWERSAAWRKAESIPDVVVQTDLGGAEAKRFGAATSGHVLLFDALGRRIFSGGITGGRGVEGTNAWGEAVTELATGHPTRSQVGPIFGCSLSRHCQEEEGHDSRTPQPLTK